mgnify:CR=1 FL=1
MFIDEARIFVKGGNGGDGAVSFHRAKYVPHGGPDGGNGGRGGSVYVIADRNENTLEAFRYRRKYAAENGENGGKQKCAGKSGEDLIFKVPVGTVVRDADTGRLLADLTEDKEKVLLSAGGRGGAGNAVFASSTRQAPRFAKPGEEVKGFYVNLELKLLADCGLIGLPNVGKSTFLSVVSAARPKIANYHFTTLEPQLGIATVDDYSFTIADIPGLIEGASEGAGLGDSFLKHIERTRLLLHFLDASGSEGRDPYEDFLLINKELKAFNPALAERPQLIALNKIDLAEEAEVNALQERLEKEGYEVFQLSAPIHYGTQALLNAAAERLQQLPPTVLYEEPVQDLRIYKMETEDFKIGKDGEAFTVEGPWVDELMREINFSDTESLQYFQRQLRRKGIIDALEEAGVEEGDTVEMGDLLFDFIF